MQQIREIVTVMALNRDDDPAAVNSGWQRGDSRYILNMRTFPSDNGDGGKAKNVKGNVLVDFDLPAGQNTAIGNRYDPGSDSVVMFIQNDLGNHSILRYWHSRGPVGEIELLMQGDYLNFAKDKVVHSANIVGDLLYWTDANNEQRMINMKRAAGVGKFEVHEIYIPALFEGVSARAADVVLTRNGVTVAIVPSVLIASGVDIQSLEAYALALATALNASPALTPYMTFDSSITKVVATATGLGVFEIAISVTDAFPSTPSVSNLCWDQPVSKYLDISDPYIIAQIFPYSDVSPFATYASDPKRNANFVDKSLFQFATRYLGADYQESTISSYSNVALPQGGCIGGETTNNCIDVNFNSPRLINKDWLVNIRAVQILVRQCLGDTDGFGPWKVVTTLFREDFVLNPVYRFRNDQFYTEVSVSDQVRLYDGIPLQSQTCEMIQTVDTTRQVIGGCTEDYDSPEVAISYTQTFSDENPVLGSTFKVRMKVFIVAPYSNPDTFGYTTPFPITMVGGRWSHWYGVIHDLGSGPVFGGIGTAHYLLGYNSDSHEPNVGTSYGQRFGSEPGFCLYSRGNPYYAFSRQRDPGTFTVPGGDLSLDLKEGNVIDSTKNGYAVFPKNSTNREAARWAMRQAPGGMWSDVEITLPVGPHLLTFASHLTGKTDVNGTQYNATNSDLKWQDDSADILMMDGVWGKTEVFVNGAAGDVITLGDCYIADLTNPAARIGGIYHEQTKAARFLLRDNGGEDNADGKLRDGTKMERQMVLVWQDDGAIFSSFVGPIFYDGYAVKDIAGVTIPFLQSLLSGYVPTDANGHGFTVSNKALKMYAAASGVTSDGISGSASVLDASACTTTSIAWTIPAKTYFEFSQTYYNGGFNILSGSITNATGHLDISVGQAKTFVFFNNNAGGVDNMDSCSTSILGYVRDASGAGVPGIRVLFENTGRTATTKDDGSFRLHVMADAAENLNRRGLTRPLGPFIPFERDRLVVQNTLLCTVTFPSGDAFPLESTTGDLGIPQFETAQRYSLTVRYNQIDTLCLVTPSVARTVFGRGATPQIGIELLDGGGRITTVGSSKSSTLQIPFATENLRLFDPSTYPVDTYRLGAATVSYNILGSVPVPKVGRFTKYRFVVTQDGSRSRVFEWAANDIRYVIRYDAESDDTINTTWSTGTANEIYIGVSNIDLYREQNTDSRVAYTPQVGDRIVMICSASGVPYTYPDRILQSEITGERTTTDTTSGRIERWLTVDFKPDWPEITAGALFLIYTPAKTTDTKAFYEVGPWMDIIDPYGTSPSWSSTTGILGDGFTYYRPRRIPVSPPDTGPTITFAYVEDNSASDFYPSKAWGQGRVNLFDPNVRQVTYGGRQRWSLPYVPGTKTNGLSTYNLLDFEDLTTEYGPIERMVMVGERLLMACWYRLIVRYPGKESVEQAVDGQFTASSTRILGASHVDNGNFGCMNGESISVRGNHAYGFDIVNGQVWRKSDNATVSISGIYKMQQDIAEKARFYRSLPRGSFHIWSTIDRYFEEYIICFPEVAESPSPELRTPEGMPVSIQAETLSFHEGSVAESADNRWMTAYSYHPECMGYAGMEILSMVGGKLWLHNRNPIRNSFYGIQYASEFEAASFAEPELRKRWLNIELKSSHKPEIPSIELDSGMRSRLKASNFIAREEDFYAEFKRNLLTPNRANPIVNGDFLVSNVIVMRMSIKQDEKFTFTCVTPVAVSSQRSQK